MIQKITFFLLAALEYVRGIDVVSTLTCGSSVSEMEFTDSDSDYYLLDVSYVDEFSIDTCGSYNYDYTSTALYLYSYSGGSVYASSIDSDDLVQVDYASYYYGYWYSDDEDCRWSDAYLELDEETKLEDNYAAQVAVSWGSYTGAYSFKVVCPSIVTNVGSLSCGEEAEGTLWENDEETWLLDIGTASEFTVSTCESESEYGVDTKLSLYGYEGDASADAEYTNTADWSALPQGFNDDDYYDYCIGDSVEDHLTHDSYLVEEDAEYDMYLVTVSAGSSGLESVDQHYNLKLECGSVGGSDALTSGSSTGVVVAAIIVPLVILVFAVWMYRKKQENPHEQQQQPMQMQQQMYAGGMMYGQQQMGAPQVTM